MKHLIVILPLVLLACQESTTKSTLEEAAADNTDVASGHAMPALDLEQANRLSQLPLKCMTKRYPNKLGQVLGGQQDLKEPNELHPAFYGCFDWHSSVHGHWLLVRLLKQFPELDSVAVIRNKLSANITPAHIAQEVEYFKGQHASSFERTYGWAWLLKLYEEVHTWSDPLARDLEVALKPLAELIAARYLEFLPKLNYAIRVGEHTNTAFGLTFAWDYAKACEDTLLLKVIHDRAIDFYGMDRECPLTWEPSGYDFLSPCLEEADLMRRVLDPLQYRKWLKEFLPQLADPEFHLEPGKVSDRTDGKLVHLDGLNFSRAWCLYGIASDLPEYSHLNVMATEHISHSLPSIVDGAYEGEHWLASFALYALIAAES